MTRPAINTCADVLVLPTHNTTGVVALTRRSLFDYNHYR